jgi:hypothetical protein
VERHPQRRSSIRGFSPGAQIGLTLLPKALSQCRLAFEIFRRVVEKDALRLQEAVKFVAAQPEQFRRLMVG